MAGERILLIDQSAAVQEITRAILEEHGFRVTSASNGLAALTHPELDKYDLVIMDTGLEGVTGAETSRLIKTERKTATIPILLLIAEENIDPKVSVALKGAAGYIAKPYSPSKLIVKVQEVMEERKLLQMSRQYLDEAAERHMQELAEQKIQQAVERKIQIIVERAIQSIVSIIDQRARREVEARVTALSTEKEQELVKLTVQEVAKSMVEKVAEKKVTEAMEHILVEQTEKTVKRAVDGMLPTMVRERLKESIENTLPREVQARVEKAASEQATIISENIVAIIQAQAQKLVPLVAKEKMPELAERQLMQTADSKLPAIIASQARMEVNRELDQRVKPLVEDEIKKLRHSFRTSMAFLVIVILVIVLGCVIGFAFFTKAYLKKEAAQPVVTAPVTSPGK